ncbi:hypothetical protein FRB96_001573 [Tulasnella sp. 330]|nr:hypothetical protein FRB96_001573 [Tulasnella sp. 330]KAG8878379.1 hypothetical protein FRB97_002542 [Tulasnella sp. 331]KAG8884476.1 hypothetical protein FRB98_002375 [Tulasnella sp. 332]
MGGLGGAGAGAGGASGTAGMLEALGGERQRSGGTVPCGFPGFGAGTGAGTAGAAPSPAMLQQFPRGMGGADGAGTSPRVALGGFGAGAGAGAGPPFRANLSGGGEGAAPSTVPGGPQPEERYQTQLQLSDMGFTKARQNVCAPLAADGNIEHAVEHIFGGGGS